MAIITDISSPAVTAENRTWRANIETPRDGNYSIQVYREIVSKDADDNVVAVQQSTTPVSRAASAIAGESVKVNGTNVPAALVLAALPLFFDRWAEEDIAAANQPREPAPEPGPQPVPGEPLASPPEPLVASHETTARKTTRRRES